MFAGLNKYFTMKNTLLLLFILIPNLVISQNLVPNPSFEEYECLPTIHANDMINCAPPWFASPHSEFFNYWSTGSPDYFNNNMEFDYVWTVDYVPPQPRTGDGSVSFIPVFSAYDPIEGYDYISNHNIESIQVKLIEPMVEGEFYDVSFYVALPDKLNFMNVNHLGTDELGVYFHTDTVFTQAWLESLTTHRDSIENVVRLDSSGLDNSGVLVPYFSEYLQEPDLKLNQLLVNIGEWIRVDTVLYADKAYEYMYFGQFNWYTEINTIDPEPSFPCYNFARVILDDVSVSLHNSIKETANAGNDTTLCIGESVVLESHDLENYIYHWADILGNEWDIANPTVNPETTTTYYLSVKDFAFNETFDSITVTIDECNESLADVYASQIKVFPNPVTTIVEIVSEYAINSWKLMDVLGKEVASSRCLVSSKNLLLDVSSFDTGLYFLEMEIDGVLVVKQLMVE